MAVKPLHVADLRQLSVSTVSVWLNPLQPEENIYFLGGFYFCA